MKPAILLAFVIAVCLGFQLATPVSAADVLEDLPEDYVPYYPARATESLSNIVFDLDRLSLDPANDPRRVWDMQWHLLTIAQALFGQRDDFEIRCPHFAEGGPYIYHDPYSNMAGVVLSFNGAHDWPTAVFEVAYQTVHLLNPAVGGTSVLEEGVAIAFSIYAQDLYGLDIYVPEDRSSVQALRLVASLPEDALLSAGLIRREIGPFGDVTSEDLLGLYPDMDGMLANALTRPFIASDKLRKDNSAAQAPVTLSFEGELEYPVTAARQARFEVMDLNRLEAAPFDDPETMWQMQLELLALAEDIFGPRNPIYRLDKPLFRETGPTIRYGNTLRSVAVELSFNGRWYWPTIVFEMAHETIHLIDPVIGNSNYLEEGAAVAFSLHAQALYGLEVYGREANGPQDEPYICALHLLHELPGDALEAAGRIRRETGPLSAVKPEELLNLFPDLDSQVADAMTARFLGHSDPCNYGLAAQQVRRSASEPRYPVTAARQAQFELMDIHSLVRAPVGDPDTMRQMQLEILALTEDILGPRNPEFQLLEPRFHQFGPRTMFSDDGKSAWIDLSFNGRDYWPTIVYEMAHRIPHILDDMVLPTYLAEGVSMAFALHVQQLYGLEVWEPPEGPWSCALELANELPGDALEAAGRIRREVGTLSRVKTEDLLNLFPEMDPQVAEIMTRKFLAYSDPCNARPATHTNWRFLREPRYPITAVKQGRFKLMDIYGLVGAPVDDPDTMLELQLELLKLAEDIFGARNSDFQLLEPRFHEFGPRHKFGTDGKSVWLDLSFNGRDNWPTIVYEMAHRLPHTFDDFGRPNYLLEGASMAFAYHVQQLYGLEVSEPLEGPWSCALELVDKLPGDTLEATGRLRRTLGSLRLVNTEDLLQQFPDMDSEIAEKLSRMFDARSNPCETISN